MESVPHRNFIGIERTAAPAFSESRARNRPDPVDEGCHVVFAVCRNIRAQVTHPRHFIPVL
jgi:hypothetical protein